MDIVIECYGVTERLAGARAHVVPLAAGARVAEALGALAARLPELARVLPSCACAVGDALVPRTRVLRAGERLALLPPVSGG